jgi:hypothetical protein
MGVGTSFNATQDLRCQRSNAPLIFVIIQTENDDAALDGVFSSS